MEGDSSLLAIAGLAIIVGSSFFVATEYALVSARRSKIEALARKGHSTAKILLRALDRMPKCVAGIQVAITMFGIGVGTVIEPFLQGLFQQWFGRTDPRVAIAASFLFATYVMVVVGELVPKYLALRDPERAALIAIRPLKFFVAVVSPIVWLAEHSAALILRVFRVNMAEAGSGAVPKEELLLLVRAGSSEGLLDASEAEIVTRALKLDSLTADDIMIHRIDVQWVDATASKDELLNVLRDIPYSRIPVCREDVDHVVGILYLHDVVKHLSDEPFDLTAILRPVVAIPENLSLDKIVTRMREERSQMLIVMDEYGGTSGIITLEDVVEEVFGELEDQVAGGRPPIEVLSNGKVLARGSVRFDELVAKLGIDLHHEASTDTLAEIVVNALDRVANLGDTAETELGLLRVESMARHRITRVSLRRN
jgi:CBS domain containing-hemolysin-like protein